MIETFNAFSTLKKVIYDKISLSSYESNVSKRDSVIIETKKNYEEKIIEVDQFMNR